MALLIGNTIDPLSGKPRPIPFEYVKYFMMRYVYHCDPITLGKVSYEQLMIDWEIAQYEAERDARKYKQ